MSLESMITSLILALDDNTKAHLGVKSSPNRSAERDAEPEEEETVSRAPAGRKKTAKKKAAARPSRAKAADPEEGAEITLKELNDSISPLVQELGADAYHIGNMMNKKFKIQTLSGCPVDLRGELFDAVSALHQELMAEASDQEDKGFMS